MRADISLFQGVYDSAPVRTVPLDAALVAIHTGAYRDAIERLRRLRATRGEAAYTKAKSSLDAFTPGGTFAPTRAKGNLGQHSGLIHGDLDHLPDVLAVKHALCADPHTAYCFVSPSGDGLKLGVCVVPVADDAAYKQTWQAVADYYHQRYGVTWDPSGKDICRLCLVSWDPALYDNPVAPLFPVPPVPPAMPRPPGHHTPRRVQRTRYVQQAVATATKILDTSTPGNRHHARTKAAYLLGGYVAGGILSAEEARATLAAAVPRNTAHVERAMQTVEACLAAGMQAAITLEGSGAGTPSVAGGPLADACQNMDGHTGNR